MESNGFSLFNWTDFDDWTTEEVSLPSSIKTLTRKHLAELYIHFNEKYPGKLLNCFSDFDSLEDQAYDFEYMKLRQRQLNELENLNFYLTATKIAQSIAGPFDYWRRTGTTSIELFSELNTFSIFQMEGRQYDLPIEILVDQFVDLNLLKSELNKIPHPLILSPHQNNNQIVKQTLWKFDQVALCSFNKDLLYICRPDVIRYLGFDDVFANVFQKSGDTFFVAFLLKGK